MSPIVLPGAHHTIPSGAPGPPFFVIPLIPVSAITPSTNHRVAAIFLDSLGRPATGYDVQMMWTGLSTKLQSGAPDPPNPPNEVRTVQAGGLVIFDQTFRSYQYGVLDFYHYADYPAGNPLAPWGSGWPNMATLFTLPTQFMDPSPADRATVAVMVPSVVSAPGTYGFTVQVVNDDGAPFSGTIYVAITRGNAGSGVPYWSQFSQSVSGGVANMSINFPPPGAEAYTLQFFQDSNYLILIGESFVFVNDPTLVPNPATPRPTSVVVSSVGSLVAPPVPTPYVVGSIATVSATVRDQFASPMSGRTVRFTRMGTHPGSIDVATNSSGVASFSYTGTSQGADAVLAQVLGADAATAHGGTVILWTATLPPVPPPEPAVVTAVHNPTTNAVRQVGQVVCFTVTVRSQFGATMSGIVVHVERTGVNPVTPRVIAGTTGADGTFQYCYTGANPGADVLRFSVIRPVTDIYGPAVQTWTVAPPSGEPVPPAPSPSPGAPTVAYKGGAPGA